MYVFLANVVVLAHLAFIVFVVWGGLLVFWRPWLAWIHLPIAAYGVLIEWVGWVCPLTPLENRLRMKGGRAGYEGGFVEEYLLPLIYPAQLTRTTMILLGCIVLVVNLVIYGTWFLRRYN